MGTEHSPPSPPYPAYGLPDVVERALRLTTLPVGTPVSRGAVYGALGFGSVNGTSKSFINALKQFRLIVGQGTTFEVSPEVSRLKPEAPAAERRALLADLARRPPIFRELDDHYPDALGQRNDQARAYLAASGFRQAAIGTVLAVYRATREMLVQEGVVSCVDPDLARRSDSAGADLVDDIARGAGTVATGSGDGRTLFGYAFEGGGELKVVVEGSAGIDEILQTIEAWLRLKRAELDRIRTA
ncbi:hypothetical protein FHR71_003929 [Methylobacterium sp. RAS18]|nr:hypothetical protein [Methylobacterium sp. RAS18]